MSEQRTTIERGQSLVLVAAAMVVLVGFVALAVDLGNAYYARRTAQNGADGAALAGVAEMAVEINHRNKQVDDNIQAAMNEFAELNGIEDTNDQPADDENTNVEGWYVDMMGNRVVVDGIEVRVGAASGNRLPDDAYGVEAITHITATAFFGGIFGAKGYPVQARAVSLLKQVCSADCVLPITTDITLMSDAVEGECFNIWRESQTGSITETVSPGIYGWVSWTWQEAVCGNDRPCPEVDQGVNGCDTGVLTNNLDPSNCASGFIEVGDWMSSTSGKINGDDVRCMLDYYLGIPHPIEECGVSSNEVVPFIFPLYDISTADPSVPDGSSIPCLRMSDPTDPSSGGLHYRVKGFARMELLGYQLSQGTSEEVSVGHDGYGCVTIGEIPNNGSRITARFIQWVDDSYTSSECYDPSGSLLHGPKLTE